MLSVINNKTQESNQTKKIAYIECLRVVACVAVVVIHISGDKLSSSEGWYWNILNIFDGLSRWAVPIFFMITGVTFLNKDKSISEIYKKYISRMVVILMVWSTFYAITFNIGKDISILEILETIIKGHYHLWFIYAIIGIYSIIPFLKKIVEDKKLCKYFLVLWFIVGVVIQTISKIPKLENVYKVLQDKISLYFVLGYSGYSILGYCIHNIQLIKKEKKIIYILGILSAILTVVGTTVEKRNTLVFYSNLSPNITFMALAIFVLFKENRKIDNIKTNSILKISELTLGIYLIHPLIFNILKYFGINTTILNPIVMVPLIFTIVFTISAIIIKILRKIKLMNKIV